MFVSAPAPVLKITVLKKPFCSYAATLGRKVSTLSWSGGMGNGNGHHPHLHPPTPSTPSRFRSLGRGANFLSTSGMRRKSEGVQHRGTTTPTNVRMKDYN